jgi:hypothetical protein
LKTQLILLKCRNGDSALLAFGNEMEYKMKSISLILRRPFKEISRSRLGGNGNIL